MMAAKAQKRIVAPLPPTAIELAAQVVDLTKRRDALEPEAEALREQVFSIEKDRVVGKKINEISYRKARDAQGDIDIRLIALNKMLEDTQEQGERTLAAEIIDRELSLKKERGELVRERRQAIEGRLMPLFAAFIVERELSTGLSLSRFDSVYLAEMPGVGFGPEEKRALFAEVEKRKKSLDLENSLGAKLQRIEYDLRKITNKTLPSFARMVQDAQ
jgi:hypothetical protein